MSKKSICHVWALSLLVSFLSACTIKKSTATDSGSVSTDHVPNSLVNYDSSEYIHSTGRIFKLSNGKIISLASNTKKVTLYDPKAEKGKKIVELTDLQDSSNAASMVLLSDDRILIAGGADSSWMPKDVVEIYDPNGNEGEGSSVIATPLQSLRISPSLVRLSNGKVLIMGGRLSWSWDFSDAVELYDPTGSGSVTSITSLNHPRYGNTATVLGDGKILLIGGSNSDVELYDPAANDGAGSTIDRADLNYSRINGDVNSFTSTLLPNGKILVVGGVYGGGGADPTNAIELYDPSGGGSSVALTPIVEWQRHTHAAVLLSTGKVLIIGGTNPWTQQPETAKSVVLYDPSGSGSSKVLTDLPQLRRYDFSTLLLENDVVLLGGGYSSSPIIDFYDPNANGGDGGVLTDSASTPLSIARANHTATVLPDGKVLIVGGENTYDPWSVTESVQIYNPGTNQVTSLAPLPMKKYDHTATLLPNGKVLIVGGVLFTDPAQNNNPTASVELYDPSGSGSVESLGELKDKRSNHQTTLLSNGKLLITGGYDGNWNSSPSVELYDPTNGGSSVLLEKLGHSRADHSAHLLSSNKVVLIGGYDGSAPSASVELYDPTGAGSTTELTGMVNSRVNFTSNLLKNGKILIMGGYTTTDWKVTNSVELYDPDGGGTSLELSSMNFARYEHSSVLLPNGKILITGGNGSLDEFQSKLELYDVDADLGVGQSTLVDDALTRGRSKHTATLLQDGSVWIYGGYGIDWYKIFDDWAIYYP